jgi:zinc protease
MNWETMMTKKLFRNALHVALAAAIAVPLFAQQPPDGDKSIPTSKVERKGKAPVNPEVLKVKLPRPVKATLSNGMRVLIIEDHRFPFVTTQMSIAGAGALFDPADRPGLATITAQMLREGTAKHSSKEIAELSDQYASNINVMAPFGSPDATVMASGLKETFDDWFALANEILLQPTFPADEFNKLRQRTKFGLRQQRTNANFLANERFSSALYGNHPAAVVSPTPVSLDAMTPEALKQFHDAHYLPQNTILGIAGDVDAKTLIPKLEKMFASWKKTDDKVVLPENTAPATARKVYLVNRPGSVQTNILLGNIAIDRRSSDYFPMLVTNRILGGGASARFFMNLREEKGYTYGAYSRMQAVKYPGPWLGNSEVRTDVTAGALKEFMYEMTRIENEPVPASELEDAKHSLVASFALSLETPGELLGSAMTSEIYGFPDDYWDTYPQHVMAVTNAEIERVAKKYLSPGSLQIVAVGDGAKIQSVLETLGPVEVFNTDGKLQAPKTTGGEKTGN